jgi:signal transduction histidine kinase
MQAAAARHVLRAGDAVADPALATIGDLASTALGEVRALLYALRDDRVGESLAGGLQDVAVLADRLTTPARRVTVSVEGRVAGLPSLVSHSGYRLVQEALTNAVRHSGAGHIHVVIRRDGEEEEVVVIAIEDDGPTSPPVGTRGECVGGQGIRGMRERVRLLGGTFRIMPRRPHGWRVEATLPCGPVWR